MQAIKKDLQEKTEKQFIRGLQNLKVGLRITSNKVVTDGSKE